MVEPMAADQRSRLATIRRFDQLVAYLRDDMGWPIESDDFEELTFEYAPEELGIDAKNAAKIQEIKRLRPLAPSQPWGIFFVKFEPKRLPVVALRRILGQVALKKRVSANKSERQAWADDDLLFVSNYGEGSERRIAFAHFAKPANGADLPTLKVLGWDNLDTPLHLDDVAEKLTRDLAWPDDPDNAAAWRARWRGAFTLRHREVISTSQELSIRLAELARAIRDRIKTILGIETEKGRLTQLMKVFRTALIHDLDAEAFADMYAQTISYGLLSARIADPHKKTADDLAAHIGTNPFLQELLEAFLEIGGRRGKAGGPGLDFDELGVSEVVELLDDANMEAVVADFGDRNPQEDPVVHFYELFLKEYDPKKRMQRGVFYTPRPVVSYIVRAIDDLLRTEFGVTDGLADTITWGEMVLRNDRLCIPEGVSADQPFVQILDPAAGTGTFLVEVIDRIHKTLQAKWKSQGRTENELSELWNHYVARHLLPRLHGYEVLMAPYAIAHLKVRLKLYETGYHFGSDERAKIYLTNSLEPPSSLADAAAAGLFDALANEAREVNEVKWHRRMTVVLGNPPYAVEGVNKNKWIDGLMGYYREDVKNERNIQLLSDDYAKFIRLAHSLVTLSSGGIVGMITKNTYLNTTAFRGLRKRLQADFDDVTVLDLHGKLYEKPPEGGRDSNIFEIRVGVSVVFARRGTLSGGSGTFRHSDMWGSGDAKLNVLARLTLSDTAWTVVPADTRDWALEPLTRNQGDAESALEYGGFAPLLELAIADRPVSKLQGVAWGSGVKTNRDFLLVAFDREELTRRMELLASSRLPVSQVRAELGLEDGRYWNTDRERAKLRALNWSERIFPYLYGPFDTRFVAHIPSLIEIGRGGASKHLMSSLQRLKNVALVLKRRNLDEEYHHAFVTRHTCDINCLGGQTYVIPLELARRSVGETQRRVEIGELGSTFLSGGAVLSRAFGCAPPSPFEVMSYVYAVLHSPVYRWRYGRELRKEFPRIPLPREATLFEHLSRLGKGLCELHLTEGPAFEVARLTYFGPSRPVVLRPAWIDGAVWLDARPKGRGEKLVPGSIGFGEVPEEVWCFRIGGYQVCEKWLKDRKDRRLSKGEIAHYQKIVVALAETIRLMKEIDEVIEAHGGWPMAFQTGRPARQSALKAAEGPESYDG